MNTFSAYEQIAALLAEAIPAKILNLKASGELQTRLEFLIEQSKESTLNPEEKDELDHFIVLERLIRLAKIKAFSAAVPE